jgi:archaellum biogenesis protein FlaJ (TadC family)
METLRVAGQPLLVHPVGTGTLLQHGATPRATNACALLRVGVLLFLAAWVSVFIISVAKEQEPAWPLRNISQYAAHYPSIYLFRACGAAAATLFIQAGMALFRTARWTLPLLAISGGGLGGAAVISCTEDNDVHLSFALAAFVGFGLCMACAAALPRDRLLRRPLARSTRRVWAFQSLLIWLGLGMVVLLFTDDQLVAHETGLVMVSIIEWTLVANLLLFTWNFAGVVA